MTDFYTWQDKEIKFDITPNLLQPKAAEVEDSKGNPNEDGVFLASNLRLVWYSISNQTINLSIGYDCILTVEVKTDTTNKGLQQIISLKARQKNSRFEFIFKTYEANKFQLIKEIHKSYDSSRLYREIKARGAIAENKNLIILNREKVINKYPNVFSFSADKSLIQGTLFLTNVRVAWIAVQNDMFNISIPYICIKNMKKKDLRKGEPCVLIETRQSCGAYIVGYKFEPLEKLMTELQKMYQFFNENPNLGVQTNFEGAEFTQQTFDEDVEIVDDGYNESKYVNQQQKNDQEIIFSDELGLAIEKPQNGQSVQDIWKIIQYKS